MELIGQVSEKLDKVLNTNTNNENEKEKMDRIFEKKQLGRPVGTWETKREQYLKMLNEKKIKEPKEQTLEYYRIIKDIDKYVMVN